MIVDQVVSFVEPGIGLALVHCARDRAALIAAQPQYGAQIQRAIPDRDAGLPCWILLPADHPDAPAIVGTAHVDGLPRWWQALAAQGGPTA